MESVGQKLREARTRLGLTLEQVSAGTRITLRNLTAIEADDVFRISSPFHYRSFTKQFAAFVKLDFETIDGAVQSAAAAMPEPLMPGQEDWHVIHVPRIKPRRQWKLNWLRSVISFSLVMAVCTGVYATWHRFERAKTSAHAQARISAGPVPAPKRPVAGADALDTGFYIQLAALEKTWLSIAADGKEVFSGVLDAAETKALEGRESARIRTGNAGAVKVTFNGKMIGVLGPRGQVRTVIFTKDSYEVLPSTAQVGFSGFIQAAE